MDSNEFGWMAVEVDPSGQQNPENVRRFNNALSPEVIFVNYKQSKIHDNKKTIGAHALIMKEEGSAIIPQNFPAISVEVSETMLRTSEDFDDIALKTAKYLVSLSGRQ